MFVFFYPFFLLSFFFFPPSPLFYPFLCCPFPFSLFFLFLSLPPPSPLFYPFLSPLSYPIPLLSISFLSFLPFPLPPPSPSPLFYPFLSPVSYPIPLLSISSLSLSFPSPFLTSPFFNPIFLGQIGIYLEYMDMDIWIWIIFIILNEIFL